MITLRVASVAALASLLGLLLGATPAGAAPLPPLFALCYHDVADSVPNQKFVGVSTSKFVEQLSWLQQQGYTAVSVDDILAARDGRKPLPDKAYLLTFDDGYESFYTRVFPILKAFKLPAVIGIVGAWMSGKPGENIDYAGEGEAPERFLTWAQLRETVASGLVEVAAHTMDMHRGAVGNPQGNSEPAEVTRRYDPARGYESESAYRARITDDTEAIVATIEHETGRRPRVMIWPYGEHSDLTMSVAGAHGMPITMTLIDGAVTLGDLTEMPRHLVSENPALPSFAADLHYFAEPGPVRAVQVDLDYVYDRDPEQQNRNLGALVQRIYDYHISHVFLQAFADPAGDGTVREVYFPNRQLPVRSDLFNRAAWQLRTRAHVKVWAWMPVLAFDFGAGAGALQHVTSWDDGRAAADQNQYQRLSPFDPAARQKILELYEDLGRAAAVSGVLFHDDAVLSDREDASPAALTAYAAAGFPSSIDAIRGDPEILQRWTRFKTDALIDFTGELAARVRLDRAPLRTGRNLYARPMLEPESAAWFAQDYDRFLAAYDVVAVMAMPRLEGVPPAQAKSWLDRLVTTAAARPNGLKRTLFELQAVDWRRGEAQRGREVPSRELADEMRLLARRGALNFGYYPDDFLHDLPHAGTLFPVFSLQSYPLPRP